MMKILICLLSLFLSVLSAKSMGSKPPRNKFVVIAHRGASGYLPEHTLASAAMAHAWGVDYIEPDLVMTKDNELVILHDFHVDTTTNVKEVFPSRARSDGRYYAIDFTLSELRRLNVNERKDLIKGEAVFKRRFPLGKSVFKIPTFQEFIELIQGLNKSSGRNVGIYPEIKNPEFHLKERKDITKKIISVLREYNYERSEKAFIQCFYPASLKRLKNEFKTKIPLIQLIADNSWKESSVDYTQMLTRDGIKKISKYANGIGPWIPQLKTLKGKASGIVKWAHEFDLKVHAYTYRLEEIPETYKSEKQFLDDLIGRTKVDGLFSDFGDRVIEYLK